MLLTRVAIVLLGAALLTGCSSDDRTAPVLPSSAASSAAPVPAIAPSMSAEALGACLRVRNAFRAQATRDWETVLRELNEAWRVGHASPDRQLARMLPAPGTVRLDDTQTLGEVTHTLVFACGLSLRANPSDSPAAPDRRQVEVSASAVDGVPMGTPADEAERRLRHSLGDADVQDLTGCNGGSGRRLIWGTFQVVLSDKAGERVQLHGWSLRPGVSRVSYALPYDVQPGDAMQDVLERVPGAAGVPGEGAYDERYFIVHTDRTPDLLWRSDEKGRSGAVEEISFRDPSCD